MKNKGEIYEALAAGEKLDNGAFYCHLNENKELVDDEGIPINLNFHVPEDWEIYKEPKWYENIPAGGVLCWVSDACEKHPVVIFRYKEGSLGHYKSQENGWSSATPLTKQEIRVFMDNAPEVQP